MSNNDLDFVQTAIDTSLPAGISVACEYDESGRIKVTGSKGDKTHTVFINQRELAIFDTDKFTAAIAPRIQELKDQLNGISVKKKRKAKKKAKKRRAAPADQAPVPPVAE